MTFKHAVESNFNPENFWKDESIRNKVFTDHHEKIRQRVWINFNLIKVNWNVDYIDALPMKYVCDNTLKLVKVLDNHNDN